MVCLDGCALGTDSGRLFVYVGIMVQNEPDYRDIDPYAVNIDGEMMYGDAAGANNQVYLPYSYKDSFEAWRLNPHARRIVLVATSHIVGRNFSLGFEDDDIDQWVQDWWYENEINEQIYDWVDELLIGGTWVFATFTDKNTGAQTLRLLPFSSLIEYQSDCNDFADILKYKINTGHLTQCDQWFSSMKHAKGTEGAVEVFHLFRRAGQHKGSGGILDPVLNSLEQYSKWLHGRLAINEGAANYIYTIKADSPKRKAELEAEYRGRRITPGNVLIYTGEEEINMKATDVRGFEAGADGKAISQRIVAGGGVMPFHVGESGSATRSTADVSSYNVSVIQSMYQQKIFNMLGKLARGSVKRAYQSGKWHRRYNRNLPKLGRWRTRYVHDDLTRQDNEVLTKAMLTVANAMDKSLQLGIVDLETATDLLLKFGGEAHRIDDLVDRLHRGKRVTDSEILDGENELHYAAKKSAQNGGIGYRVV